MPQLVPRLTFLFTAAVYLSVLHSPFAVAQENHVTVSGIVTDAETGELVVGATLYLAAQDVGGTTNQYGFYSLTLQPDSVRMIVNHVAYVPQVLTYASEEDLRLDISLVPVTFALDEIEVIATVESALQTTQMSGISLPVQNVEVLPALLGEVDVLRIIQLLPGVQSGVEGSTGLYVRGGGPDQNLYLLDGTQIYNPSHLFGFLSTFNPDAIKDVRLLKGGFPARYGGRLSSVIDLTMKEGNMKRFAGAGAIGLLASRLTVEGCIVRDQASFLVAGRRSYADVLARPFLSDEDEDFGYYFYDVNVKTNVIITPRDRIYLSGYLGDDRLYQRYNYSENERDEAALNWSNLTGTFRWNHIFGARFFSNVLVGYTNYSLLATNENQYTSHYVSDGEVETRQYSASYESGIRDLHARADAEFIPNARHNLRFGLGGQLHSFLTGAYEEIHQVNDVLDYSLVTSDRRSRAGEFQAYIEDDWRLAPRVRLNTGIHTSSFLIDGKTYYSVEPRIGALFRLDSRTSFKASLAYMQQYIHLLATTSGLSLPTDLWVPATARIKPQQSMQVAGGAVHSISGGKFEISIEGYYKQLQNLIEYEDGADFFNATLGTWEDRVETGRGVAYGGEVFLQKQSGRTTGWIGYTLSSSRRKFDRINDGAWFPYRYDRRHDAALVISHKLRPSFDISASWVYGTGQAVTLPVGHIHAEDQTFVAFPWGRASWLQLYSVQSSRNGARMPSYHRLDLSIRIKRTGRRLKRTLSIGTYNTYNRRNALSIYAQRDPTGDLIFKKFSLLPIIPAISYQLSY
ncbi:MAG: TonB-dependent receptor plug domain-containing protein [Rhodothermaceae bacterium]|nr:TonB-dependent receptor plug domain-containing protein [Rhodothermaceae bacterium]MYD19261.1 TonB-dependent receptor plug domain-containing protein [Rhodothermaceae bacterium]MYI43879.1 TonB-dependent receptor plug domain-containing protein [Rhodothermaceae bacterium]